MRPLISGAAGLILTALPAVAFEAALPLACTPGVDCVVQHYVDRDPGPDRIDYMCGHQTYDGHDGIDIRIPSLKRMEEGVAVLAVAPGIVAATRDGMADINVDQANPGDVKDRECGNGVLIEHGDGWVSQYCHMKKGSIRVEKGDEVETGTQLGEVGLSGNTEFPHLHITFRKDDKVVDPFAVAPLAGGACTVAGDPGTSIWTPEVRTEFVYRPAFVLNAGFSDAPVDDAGIESGNLGDVKISGTSPALVFYGRAIGLEAGDTQRLVIHDPDGGVFTENTVDAVDKPKDQYFAFIGKKRHEAPWPPGTYRGRYSVIRDGNEIAFKEAELTIGRLDPVAVDERCETIDLVRPSRLGLRPSTSGWQRGLSSVGDTNLAILRCSAKRSLEGRIAADPRTSAPLRKLWRGNRPHANSNTMSWAPCQRQSLPSAARFSRPLVMVRKWLPASCPTLLAKRTPP